MKIPMPAVIQQHSKEILFGGCLAGMWCGAISAVIATPKAVDEFRKAATKKDKTIVLAKHYSPSVIVMVLSTIGLITVLVCKNKQIAGLALAAAATEKMYSDYQEAAKETVGEKKELEIRDKLAEKIASENQIPEELKSAIASGNGTDVICQDLWTGRYFISNRQKIDAALNEVNAILNSNDYVSLNALYYQIGLDPVDGGVELGWNRGKGLLSFDYPAVLKDDSIPVLGVKFSRAPTVNYTDMYSLA